MENMDNYYQTGVYYIQVDPHSTIELHHCQERDFFHYCQEAVEGMVEVVYPQSLPKGYLMLVNESGLLQHKEINPVGSVLYGDMIVGTIVLAKQIWTDDGPDIGGLESEEEVDALIHVIETHMGLFLIMSEEG